MISWALGWLWWFSWRLAITFACMYTIMNFVQQEGYRIEWTTMMVVTVCAIVGIRLWMPSSTRLLPDNKEK